MYVSDFVYMCTHTTTLADKCTKLQCIHVLTTTCKVTHLKLLKSQTVILLEQHVANDNMLCS